MQMLENAQVVAHELMGDPQYQIMRLVLYTDIAMSAKPGQFVHIQVSTGLDPLLRRPISLAEINAEKKEITLFYRIRGKGTERLAQVKPGEQLSIMGPIGQGFTLPNDGELVLVAGGIGAFPLLALAQQAKARNLSVRFFWGGESSAFFESAGLKYWKEAGIPVAVSTLDGSLGERGNVLDLIKRSFTSSTPHTSVAVCGPNPMMQAISEYFLESNYSVEASLEERMGCAVGACLGCVCTLKDENSENLRRAKVCKDGPVFNAKEVLWNGEI
jgi:dihydroorotate dehydrogenase electron transfer subunit